jgi:MFS family permease
MTGAAPVAGSTRPYYGWVVAIAAAGGFAVSSGIGNWAFGAFVKPLESDFGWSRAQTSVASGAGLFAIGVASPIVGWWVDRWGPRSAILAGSLLTATGFVALAGIQDLWQFYVLYTATAFVRTLTTYIPLLSLVARWFPENNGRAMGIVMAGLGFGGVIFAPVATLLIQALGWRGAYVALGGIFVAYFLPTALLVLRDRAVPRRLSAGAAETAYEEGRSWGLAEAVHTRAFWVLNLAISLMWVSQVGFMAHAQPFFEWRDFSPGVAALVVGLAALLAAAGRLGAGVVYDRMRQPRTFALGVCACGSAALAVLVWSTHPAAIAIFLVLWGIGSGGSAILPPVLTSAGYGTRYIGTLLGFTEVTGSAGSALGPLLGGLLFDSSGSYTPAFLTWVAIFALTGVCFAAFVAVRRSEPPRAVIIANTSAAS